MPAVSLRECVAASVASYPLRSKGSDMKCLIPVSLKESGWEYLAHVNGNKNWGYAGLALYHRVRRVILIAHAGTENRCPLRGPLTHLCNAHLVWLDWSAINPKIPNRTVPRLFRASQQFVEHVRKKMKGGPTFDIVHTGHSLGDAIGAYATARDWAMGRCDVVSLGFDGPGITEVLSIEFPHCDPKVLSQGVATHQLLPNIVNTQGIHSGKVMQLPMGNKLKTYVKSKPPALQHFTLLESHRISHFAESAAEHGVDLGSTTGLSRSQVLAKSFSLFVNIRQNSGKSLI